VIDDGLLDVIVFKRLGYLEIIKYLQDVVFSSDIRVPEIEYSKPPAACGKRSIRPVEVEGNWSVIARWNSVSMSDRFAFWCPSKIDPHSSADGRIRPTGRNGFAVAKTGGSTDLRQLKFC